MATPVQQWGRRHDERTATGYGRGGLLRCIAVAVLALFLALVAIVLLAGGGWLLFLGGSPYYVMAGAWLVPTAWMVLRGRALAATLYSGFIVLTAAWAMGEAGLDGWALMPRLAGPGVVLICFALVLPLLDGGRARERQVAWLATGAACSTLLGICAAAALASPYRPALPLVSEFQPGGMPTSVDWPSHRGPAGTQFTTAAQITPANVGMLETAWTFHTGDLLVPRENGGFEATPLKVGNMLFLCTPHSSVIALSPTSGQQVWRYDARPGRMLDSFAICRGVTYYTTSSDVDGRCGQRVAVGTADFRLIILDASDGRPCGHFGKAGIVELDRGFPRLSPGAVTMTSPPTFINGLLVVGHFVMDNQRTDAPPGVVRAYDADTGAFRWAWDMGNPEVRHEPEPGETYSLGRPNAWAGFTADQETGLVFVPLGNPGADYFGGHRTPDMRKYGSSLVALDAVSGRPRWHFQTVHQDIWDYDLPTPPALVDIPTAQGSVPALVQPTKTGQIYVLRRSDGTPLVPVNERPVTTAGAPGETPSPTQPFSAMPDLGGPDLSERDTWGITPIDQMLCRISFLRAHYDGRFTPLRTTPTLYSPGFSGGVNWGGVAIDSKRGLVIANVTRVANLAHLIERPQPSAVQGDPGHDAPEFFPYPQKGTPYSVSSTPWLSALGVPCQAPPWGTISAIDLLSRKVRWERPLGDASRSGPLGIRSYLPLTIGTPNKGGALSTASGLTFIGASVDGLLRAFDTATGEELWRARLPGGGHAIPMSYVQNGIQYVVIAAGGSTMLGSEMADTLVAFRLPDSAIGENFFRDETAQRQGRATERERGIQ